MAIQTIDNFNVVAKKPTDSRYTDPSGTPWASTSAVTTGINSNQRYVGLTVAIGTPAVEWWFKGGIADGNLVEKTSGAGSAGAENGLNINGSNKVALGGSLITPTTVATDSTNTLTVTGLSDVSSPDYLVSMNSSGKLQKSTYTTAVPIYTSSNGITKTLNNFKLGGSLSDASTFVELNQKTLTFKDTVYTSQTGITILPGNDPKTSDLNWSLNTNSFAGKNIFQTFSYFANNVGIGTFPEPTNSATATSNTRLNVYRYTGYSSNPIATTTASTLNMADDLGTGNTSIYAGNFGNLRWAPTTDQTSGITQGSISGNSSYLSLVSANDTAGGFLSSTAAQIYTAAASSIFITGVSSSGGTITVPNTTDMTNIVPGYQVIIKPGGTGDFGYVNVYVNTVNAGAFTFTVKAVTGGSRTAGYTYTVLSSFTTALSGARIVVAKADYGDDLGSIDTAIGIRLLAPAADRYSGSSFRIDSAVGLQIDNQLANISNPYNPWNFPVDLTSGYIGETYAIKQKGPYDINQLNGPLQLPSANTSIGTATLIGGTKTVSTTAVKTGSRIFISRNTPVGTVGHLSAPVASIVDSTSFVINSSSVLDTSTVNWWVIQS